MTTKAFLTFQHGSKMVGTLHLTLDSDIVPKTVQNFVDMLPKYKQCPVHRLIPGFMLQTGDIGGRETTFPDENFQTLHSVPGTLSMANAGPDTNGSQFFVTFCPTTHLDGKHVVFGRVDLDLSADVLKQLERVKTDRKDQPLQSLTVVDCGLETQIHEAATPGAAAANVDDNEIELEEGEADQNQQSEEDEFDDGKPLSKAEKLKRRLRKVKQKMNQARQLNRQAVKEEGERSNAFGAAKERKRQTFKAKQAKATAWNEQNAKAIETASSAGLEAKYITEQAADSVYKERVNANKKELHQFNVSDYHNPEGQYRHYQRDIKTMGRYGLAHGQNTDGTPSTFTPLQINDTDREQERMGARRVANEMHRRIEKSQQNQLKKRKGREEDVSYINDRNKRFNQKLSRTYDKATREIRENLERGTAL